jgi:hypothetical protein
LELLAHSRAVREPLLRVFLIVGQVGDEGLAGAIVLCQPLDGVYEVAHALAPYEAGVFVEEGIESPLALVKGVREVAVSDGYVDAVWRFFDSR